MTEQQFLDILIYGVIFAGAYMILAQPKCQAACKALFEPLGENVGRLFASALLTGLIGSAT